MDVKLEVATGPKAGQLISVTGEKFLIGRAEDCHLKPRSELISRYHCAIISTEAYVAVRDLGSKNGIFLNGNRVSLETAVADGDKLVVGPLEFIMRVTIKAKAAKKPKVESIAEAAQRTVELHSASGEDKLDIMAWLGAAGDMDISDDQDTITVAGPVVERRPPEEMPSAEAKNKPQEGASTRDVAASALRNFFRSGKEN